jgi:amino acid permease
VIAASVSNLELIISVVGITVGTLIAFVLPPIMHTLTFWHDWHTQNRSRAYICAQIVKNALMIVIGVFAIFFGLYSNVTGK